MIVDGHTHGLHGGYLDQIVAAGGGWAQQRVDGVGKIARTKPQYLDVALRVEQLGRTDIDIQVVTPALLVDANLCPADSATRLALVRAVNDNMARLMEDSKGKLAAVGCVLIGDFEPAGRREMERAIKELGLRGVNLPTTINGKPLDAPEFEPFWACANDMNVTVFTHPLQQGGHPTEMAYDLPHIFGWPYETVIMLARLVFSGVMERYTDLKIVSHHLGGGMIPFFMRRIEESNDPTSTVANMPAPLPKPLRQYFSRFYYDSAVGGSAAAIRCALEEFGADQIVFATDAPHGPEGGLARLRTYPELIRSLGLPAADTESILAGNMRRILGL